MRRSTHPATVPPHVVITETRIVAHTGIVPVIKSWPSFLSSVDVQGHGRAGEERFVAAGLGADDLIERGVLAGPASEDEAHDTVGGTVKPTRRRLLLAQFSDWPNVADFESCTSMRGPRNVSVVSAKPQLAMNAHFTPAGRPETTHSA